MPVLSAFSFFRLAPYVEIRAEDVALPLDPL
jgi:hypothetical protein